MSTARRQPRAAPLGPQGQRVDRLELHLSYRCPNRCQFCSEAERLAAFGDLPVSWGMVATVLRRQAELGVTKIHFTGGEPTLHPRLLDALRLARKLSMSTSVSTNGVRLSRASFAHQAVGLLDDAMFSLHGPAAEVHDGLTGRAGSFDQVVGAMRTVRRLDPSFTVHVNIVVSRHNVDVLADTVALAADLGASLIVVSNVSPEGRGAEQYRDLAVPLGRLAAVLPSLPSQAPEAIVRFFAMPMCLLGDHAMLSNDLFWDPRVTVEWRREPGKVVYGEVHSFQPSRKRAHVAECDECLHQQVCMGPFERYTEEYPADRALLRPARREGR